MIYGMSQGVEAGPYINRRINSEEVFLVFNEFTSIQEILPLLNVIPEVRTISLTSHVMIIL